MEVLVNNARYLNGFIVNGGTLQGFLEVSSRNPYISDHTLRLAVARLSSGPEEVAMIARGYICYVFRIMRNSREGDSGYMADGWICHMVLTTLIECIGWNNTFAAVMEVRKTGMSDPFDVLTQYLVDSQEWNDLLERYHPPYRAAVRGAIVFMWARNELTFTEWLRTYRPVDGFGKYIQGVREVAKIDQQRRNKQKGQDSAECPEIVEQIVSILSTKQKGQISNN